MGEKKKLIISKNAYGKSKSSLKFWQAHRVKLDDLYPSEKFYLKPTLKKINSVLDVGCAAGGSYNFSKEANDKINYKGIDISSELIDIAKNLYPKGDFSIYDGKNLKFKENQFDLVFSIGVIHHLPHWMKMIVQMVKFSSSFTIFDLRLTKEKTLNNPEKFYQEVKFDKNDHSNISIPYVVINLDELKSFFIQNFDSEKFRIESFGYLSKPTYLANIPYEKIFMCCFKIEKNSLNPGIFIDFPIKKFNS